jgi:DNA invertase Pin-like site-specific DNA recombinase
VTPDETHQHGGFLSSAQYSLFYRIKGRKPSVDVAMVKELLDSGMGASAIAKQMGVGRSSVYRALG